MIRWEEPAMAKITPVASYSLTVRLRIANLPGMLGKVTSAIGEAGGDIGAVDIVEAGGQTMTRDVTFKCSDEAHGQRIVETLKGVEGITVVNVSDRTFLMHLGGKIEVNGRIAVKTRDDLSMAYTPGVARVCMAIHDDPEKVYNLTIKQHTVAVVTDGSAVLGLGDIGPEAALPVMEGKCLIFKSFAGVDAFPIALATKNVDEIVRTVKAISPIFGGINLEDSSAPRCFEIEELSDVKIVFTGAGASAIATAKLMMLEGARNIIACDRAGALYRGRTENMNPMKAWFAEHTNAEGIRGTVRDAMVGADVFIGLSGPGVVKVDDLGAMHRDAIVFAMANPTPEIMPEEAGRYVKVMATGRSDYPNQINNSCGFPGFFKGLFDVRARRVNDEMKLAAAHALANIVTDTELCD